MCRKVYKWHQLKSAQLPKHSMEFLTFRVRYVRWKCGTLEIRRAYALTQYDMLRRDRITPIFFFFFHFYFYWFVLVTPWIFSFLALVVCVCASVWVRELWLSWVYLCQRWRRWTLVRCRAISRRKTNRKTRKIKAYVSERNRSGSYYGSNGVSSTDKQKWLFFCSLLGGGDVRAAVRAPASYVFFFLTNSFLLFFRFMDG